MVVDAVIPARNEGTTVAAVVECTRACRYVRDVIVVDDGSTDDTAEQATQAGAKVILRDASDEGSKAHAMAAGVAASDADSILFVDADLLGLTPRHLDEICRPHLEGRADMSLGMFDYGLWNPLVLRFPPTTGERIIPRSVFEAIPSEELHGYTIEVMINQVITARRLRTVARVMDGVTHRTKRDKFGLVEGYKRTWRMFWDLWGRRGAYHYSSYWHYARDLTVER